jgi:signal transduction histidine kinase
VTGKRSSPDALAGAGRTLARWAVAERGDGIPGSSVRRWINATIVSIVLITVISIVVDVLDNHAPARSLGVLYLLAVVPVAVLWGTVFATLVSLVSVLTFGYLFVAPRGRFNLPQSGDWYSLIVFVITAIVVSELAARSQRTARASARLAEEQGALRRVATRVAQETSREELDALISEEVGQLLSADLAMMRHYQDDGGVSLMGQWVKSAHLVANGCPAAVDRVTELIAQTQMPAHVENETPGAGDGDAALCSAVGAPIIVEGQLWGAMIVASGAQALPPSTGARLDEFTALVAIAIANAKNRADLAASRERVVIAGDEMRRRIERDLHDGAQQQLVALAIDLQETQERLPNAPPQVRADLSRVAQGLVSTLDELREIARGIHPAILVQGGLTPALKMLARRCPVPVELDLELDHELRLAEPIEVATYYVVSEALTNVAKHANASLIRVTGDTRDGMLCVRVQDDGGGGARPARGSGLVGIIDRVEALGGTLVLRSPLGAGTSVELTLPIGAHA